MPSWSASDVQDDRRPRRQRLRRHRHRRRPQVADELFSEFRRREPSCSRSTRGECSRALPGSAVKLRISHPELAPELVRARTTPRLAARTGLDTVAVFAPWLLEGGDPAHAGTELFFFVKAWASRHPQFRVTLLDGPLAPRQALTAVPSGRPADKVESVRHGHATGDEMTSGQLLMAFTLGTAALALLVVSPLARCRARHDQGRHRPRPPRAVSAPGRCRCARLRRRGRAGARRLRRSRRRDRRPGADVRVPRLDLVPEGSRRADARRGLARASDRAEEGERLHHHGTERDDEHGRQDQRNQREEDLRRGLLSPLLGRLTATLAHVGGRGRAGSSRSRRRATRPGRAPA